MCSFKGALIPLYTSSRRILAPLNRVRNVPKLVSPLLSPFIRKERAFVPRHKIFMRPFRALISPYRSAARHIARGIEMSF